MRTDCSVSGEPLPDDIPNNVSHEEVSENQPPSKSNNTNESESRGRKRKKSSSAANDAKRNRARNKHLLRDPCSNDCKLHCILKISHSRRHLIWATFWNLSYNEKQTFAFRCITTQPPYNDLLSKVTSGKSRKFSSTYRLKDEYGTEEVVCKSFFLATLGFHPKTDSLITTIFMDLGFNVKSPKPDQRGNNLAYKRLDHKQICDHIESHNPGVNHYRREHAPQRRYLPSEITIKAMHKDFL